ncbi:hypothetical protein CTAYLR_002414 [Chrysophaeum taylorii]|uniref:NAD(P)(+) transhydrogenase (Si-specific) n=1 Tax=Chrysophaeum taylorii TaxID=2483200 RepID=A0AAD7UGB3_9STRA|nr:hypothetical protein CTAYLR_002414 [Chrysophaeum taylorii]
MKIKLLLVVVLCLDGYAYSPSLWPRVRSPETYDVIVLGGGPVGARAAQRAGELGKRALVADGSSTSETSFGGPTGLFSKALRDTAKRVSVEAYRSLGMDDESIFTQIRNECRRLATTNAEAMRRECVSTGVEIVGGPAELVDRGVDKTVRVRVGDTEYKGRNDVPFDGVRIFDSDSINGISFLPRSIAISGSGIVAVEYAKIFRKLGSSVTMVIRGDSPKQALQKAGIDSDIVSVLVSDLSRSGVTFERSSVCAGFECPPRTSSRKRQPLKIRVERNDGGHHQILKVDAFLAAIGRRPNAPKGIERVGVKADTYGNVVVDGDLRAAGNVFAAGDVLGRPFLASTGVAQGLQAIDVMFDTREASGAASNVGANFDPESLEANPFAFPVGIWSSPEVAWFGYTKLQAEQRGIRVVEGMALYKEVLRGIVFSPDGLLKLIVDAPTGVVVGVHIVGSDACEIIHYGMELVRARRTIADILEATYSAVTFHELYQVAARALPTPPQPASDAARPAPPGQLPIKNAAPTPSSGAAPPRHPAELF